MLTTAGLSDTSRLSATVISASALQRVSCCLTVTRKADKPRSGRRQVLDLLIGGGLA